MAAVAQGFEPVSLVSKVQKEAKRLGLVSAGQFLDTLGSSDRIPTFYDGVGSVPSQQDIVVMADSIFARHRFSNQDGHRALFSWGVHLAVGFRPTQPNSGLGAYRLAVDPRVIRTPKWRERQRQLGDWSKQLRSGSETIAIAVLLELTMAVDLRSRLEEEQLHDAAFDMLSRAFFDDVKSSPSSPSTVAQWCDLIAARSLAMSAKSSPPVLEVLAYDALVFFRDVEGRKPSYDHHEPLKYEFHRWSHALAEYCLAPALGNISTVWSTTLRKVVRPEYSAGTFSNISPDLAATRSALRASWGLSN